MSNITIKRFNGSAWDTHYPKTVISQVVNLSTTLADMQDDIDGKLAIDGKAADTEKLDGISSDGFSRVIKATASLAGGHWYTIAHNVGNRSSAKFVLTDGTSGLHQSVHFYAQHHYGTDSSNQINVLANSSYSSGGPFRYLRIMEAGTYEGAYLQVYADASSTSAAIRMLENFQNSGWFIVSFEQQDTITGFTQRVIIDLNKTNGINVTDDIYSKGLAVILTNDSRLSDARPASDVSSWAKQASLLAVDVPSLDASKITSGTIDAARLPSIAVTNVVTNTTMTNFLTLYNAGDMQEGDVLILTTDKKTYIHNGGSAGDATDFTLMETPTDVVTSVAGKTGVVTLVKGDVGLGNVDNTSDADKPVSTAMQTALNGKVDNSRVLTDVPAGAVFTDTVYTLPYATSSVKGGIRISVSGTTLTIYTS